MHGLPLTPKPGRSAKVRPTGRPLAWHLGLLCAALLLPVLALEGFLLGSIASGERARHEASAREAARRIAVALDRGVATLGAVAEVLATSDHLLADDLDAFRRRVQQLPRPSAAQVIVRDEAGHILMETGEARAGERDLSAEAAARRTERTQFTGALHGASPGRWEFAVITPVPERGGMSDRLLSLRVSVGELGALLAREGVPPGMVATLTDRHGTVLARTRDAERLVGLRTGRLLTPDDPQGWRRGTDSDGAPVVLAYARSELAGWTAWVLIPEAAFAAPLRRSLLAMAALGLLFAALAALLAVSFARWITRPISVLAQAAARGEAAAAPTPIREVNALAEAYEAARVEAQRLRDAQEELRHVARLNEMGALAAALAHEINQPLTAASTFAEAALRLVPESPAREAMQEAADQAVHAGAIVRRLRDFLAASGGERSPAELNKVVREAVSLALADARDRGIALRFDLAPDLPEVVVDRVQIAQVVVNLVRNAVEAIGDAPRRDLVVSTHWVGVGLLEVRISDTGSGIEPEIAARLFAPFVTTKPGGMGVGLAISRGIVEEHGGRLLCAPNPGGGSVFRFTLPVVTAVTAAEEASHAG